MEVVRKGNGLNWTIGQTYKATTEKSGRIIVFDDHGYRCTYRSKERLATYFTVPKDEGRFKKVSQVTEAVAISESELDFINNIIKVKPMNKNQIKQAAVSIRNSIKPYEKYIVATAVLVAIDYFILKGAGSQTIKDIATRTFDKLSTVVNKGIDKLLGE